MKDIVQNVQFAGFLYVLMSCLIIIGIIAIVKRLKLINDNLKRLIELKTKEKTNIDVDAKPKTANTHSNDMA